MCLAVPGKIVSISDGLATVCYPHETRTAKIIIGSYKPDDYVIVQSGIVIEKVSKKQVETWDEFLTRDSR